jgi:anti-anti-sigma factor
MHYDLEVVGNVSVVRIREKRLTSHEAPEMKTALLGVIIGEGKKFLINLKEVESMDSTALGSFLFGIRQAEHHSKDIRFCELNPKIQFLIRIAHLGDVIRNYETEEEALMDFRKEEKDG